MAENVLGHQSLFGQLTCAARINLAHNSSQTGKGAVELRDAVSRSISRFVPKLAEICPSTASLLIWSVRSCYKLLRSCMGAFPN